MTSENENIAATYNATAGRATKLEGEVEVVETRAREALETTLGLEPSKPLPDRPVFGASSKDLDRWSYDGIPRVTLRIEERGSKFPVVELGTVGKISYGLRKFLANWSTTHPHP